MWENWEKAWPHIRKMMACFVLVGLVIFLSGCRDDSKKSRPSKQVGGESKVVLSKPKVKEPPKTVAPAVQVVYRYLVKDRRDPFRSILIAPEDEKLLADLPPLQRVELGELRVVGIVWGEMGYSAMVRTEDGRGYTLQVGTRVGRNKGKVKKITKGYLMIKERFTDVFGDHMTREVRLDLHPQEEGSE